MYDFKKRKEQRILILLDNEYQSLGELIRTGTHEFQGEFRDIIVGFDKGEKKPYVSISYRSGAGCGDIFYFKSKILAIAAYYEAREAIAAERAYVDWTIANLEKKIEDNKNNPRYSEDLI